MTAALICDGIDCKRTGQPGSNPPIEAWWRVERHGMEWAEEVGRPPEFRSSPISQRISFSTNLTIAEDAEEEDGGVDVEEADEEADYLDSPPLHFCSVACLSSWAGLANMTEGSP